MEGDGKCSATSPAGVVYPTHAAGYIYKVRRSASTTVHRQGEALARRTAYPIAGRQGQQVCPTAPRRGCSAQCSSPVSVVFERHTTRQCTRLRQRRRWRPCRRYRETPCRANRERRGVRTRYRRHLVHLQREALARSCAHSVAGCDGDRVTACAPRPWRPTQSCGPVSVVFERHTTR